jgi:uncharacterized membrane protein
MSWESDLGLRGSLSRCIPLILIFLSFLFASGVSIASSESPEFQVESVILRMYRDGVAHVTQVLRLNETIPQVTLPLLSAPVVNVLVVDENETLLDYEIDGSQITIFTLGAIKVTLYYDTAAIASMEAGVWTLSFSNPFNLTVILPEDAEVIYLSDVPSSIDIEANRITLFLYPGDWEVSYVLPIAPMMDFEVSGLRVSPSEIKPGEEVTISVLVTNVGRAEGSYDVVLKVNGSVLKVKTVTLGGGESTRVEFTVSMDAAGTYIVEVAGLEGRFEVKEEPPAPFPIWYVALPIGVAAVASAVVLVKRGRRPNIKKILESHPYLRQEERDVLIFLAENNGKAFEFEIRRKFPHIPRTSLWRLIRRLEKQEIVKIRRVGPGNMVELKK